MYLAEGREGEVRAGAGGGEGCSLPCMAVVGVK